MTGRRPACDVAAVVASASVLVASGRRARRSPPVGPVEEAMFRWFNRATDRIRWPVWTVMQVGSLPAVFVVGGVVAGRGRTRAAAAVVATGLGVWAGVKSIKPMVGRGRPAEYLDEVAIRGVRQNGLGFPSGHAAVALTIASLAAGSDGRARGSAIGLGVAVGGARMYVGAHLPLDVAGGLAIGSLAVRAASSILAHDVATRR